MLEAMDQNKDIQKSAPVVSQVDTRKAFFPHELDEKTKAAFREGYQGRKTPELDHLLDE